MADPDENMAMTEKEELPTTQELVKLAAGGSVENQVLLGKRLLDEAKADENPQDKAQHAIKWLIKASRQGNEEATDLLRECVQNETGVTEENIENVQWCLEATQFEKKVRHAARNLFQKLVPSEGVKNLTNQQYHEALLCVAPDKNERKMLEKAGKIKNKDSISEDEFVDRVLKKIHGSGGLTVASTQQSEVENEAYRQSNMLTKLYKFPTKTVSVVVDYTLETASKRGMSWLMSLIPTHQIHMLIVFFIYSVLSLKFILAIIPVFLFYISFFTMIICSMQMFYTKKKVRDIQVLTNILKRFNESVDADTAESSFTWNTMTPYGMYFGALLICVMSFAIVGKDWIPCSECVFIAFVFFISCFIGLSDRYDHLALLSVWFDFLSTLPTIFEQFPRIPGLYHLLNLFAGTLFSIEIIPGLNVNFGLPSLAYVVVPLLFLRMAMQKSWQGTYRVLIPHLVCFFWWQVTVMFFTHSTWMGLIRGSFGWIAIILLLPVFGVGLIVTTIIYCVKILSITNLLKVLTTMVLIAIPAGLGFWAQSGFKAKSFNLKDKSARSKIILGIISVFSIIPIVYFLAPPERNVGGEYLNWEKYRKYCSEPAWNKTSMANAQATCSHFNHMMVTWSGKVNKVMIAKIDNQAESFLDVLPTGLSDWFKCIYGDHYPDCKTGNFTSQEDRELCELQTLQGHTCHMKRMNYYTFNVWVKMKVDDEKEIYQDVILVARNQFKNIVLALTSGDDVMFRASLKADPGGLRPQLYVYHLECSTCADVKQHALEIEKTLMDYIQKSVYSTFNFLMAPLIEFDLKKD